MIGQMDVTVLDLLNQFREASTINRTRGTWFEELIAEYLRVDPTYTARFSDVWMWDDWPDRTGPDTGIDIVARERDTGGYCAIQCKFYEPSHRLSKADIDSFFTASGKHPFTSRLIVSTTDKWTKHAFDALENQRIKGKNTSFTVVIGRQRQGDVFESSLKYKRPEYAGNAPEYQHFVDFTGVYDGFHHVQRAGADVAINDAKRDK